MSLRYYTSALTLELDAARCNGCGRCVEVCPHDVFALVRASAPVDIGGAASRHRRHAQIVHRAQCMECGACARNCTTGAIRASVGVGCATAIINGMLRGTAPDCDCGGPERKSCGGDCC